MADIEQPSDEYQYTELDPLNPNALNNEQDTFEKKSFSSGAATWLSGNRAKRNAIFLIVLFVVGILLYNFIGSYLAEKKYREMQAPAVLPIPEAPSILPPQPVPQLDLSTQQSDIQSKLRSVESNQENLRADIVSVNNQIATVDTNLESLSTKVERLTAVLSALTAKLDAQALIIERMTVKPVPKIIHHRVKSVVSAPSYYIQAVIPGRAWLIATNGNTVTVREGSPLRGYGRIKLIDPNQGRILTSSGRVIRFNQNDS